MYVGLCVFFELKVSLLCRGIKVASAIVEKHARLVQGRTGAYRHANIEGKDLFLGVAVIQHVLLSCWQVARCIFLPSVCTDTLYLDRFTWVLDWSGRCPGVQQSTPNDLKGKWTILSKVSRDRSGNVKSMFFSPGSCKCTVSVSCIISAP